MRMRLVIAALGFALLCASPARAATITIDSLSVAPDASFLVSIGISADVANLIAFSFDVGYDPTALALEGVQEGNFLSRGGETLPCTVGPTAAIPCATASGSVSIGNFPADFLAFMPVSGTGMNDVLVFLSFRALAAGTTLLQLSLPSLVDSDFMEIPTTLVNGTITVGTPAKVPEPSTMLLLGLGVAGFVGRRWRRGGAESLS
jgi:hypothetical protein